jgi:uridine phosphorylase
MQKNDYPPFFEFEAPDAGIIFPATASVRTILPKYCVITYFREAIFRLYESGLVTPAFKIQMDGLDVSVFASSRNGREYCIALGVLGGPGSAICLEQLIAEGCSIFVICGSAGCLRSFPLGRLLIPDEAVRDEGLSHHYQPLSKTIRCHQGMLHHIRSNLEQRGISHTVGKIWTTDAFYLETHERVRRMENETCLAVDMETAAYQAVAQARNVALGSILYAGDDLSGPTYRSRDWYAAERSRSELLSLAIDLCTTYGG